MNQKAEFGALSGPESLQALPAQSAIQREHHVVKFRMRLAECPAPIQIAGVAKPVDDPLCRFGAVALVTVAKSRKSARGPHGTARQAVELYSQRPDGDLHRQPGEACIYLHTGNLAFR